MHEHSHAVAGAVSSLVFLASAGAQLARGRDRGITRAAGVASAAVGVAMLTAATWTAVLPLFILGAVATGLGGGLLFKTLLATVVEMAPPERKGEVLAAFFFAAYLGLAVPVVALGGLAELVSTQVLMTIFAVLVALTLAWSARALDRAGPRPEVTS
jgi:MFS family permease